MSPIVNKPPIVAGTPSGNELLRQKLQRMREWDCPSLDYDPGFGEMRPGEMWIRSDMPEGCERYRFYNEKGEIVTLCFEGGDFVDTDTDNNSVIMMKAMCRRASTPDIVSNTTTQTDFATQLTIPANTSQEQDLFRVHICGTTRVDPIVNANFRLRLYLDTWSLIDTGNLTMVAPNTNAPWDFLVDFMPDNLENPEFASMHWAGVVWAAYNTAVAPQYYTRPANSGNGTGTGYSADTDTVIKVSCQWDTADTDNQCELTMFNVMKGRVGGGL